MARELTIRSPVVILPTSRMNAMASRAVEIRASKMLIEYPDSASAQEVVEIMEAAAQLMGAGK